MKEEIRIQTKRNEINKLIRSFFEQRGFLEAQTPTLVKCAGQEPYLSPIKVNFKDEKENKYEGFLITSPEYSLKKMLSMGFGKIFELARVFRSEEYFGGCHNIEFTMLEWYRANADYTDIMKDTEDLVVYLNKKINKSNTLVYNNQKIDLKTPWPKLSVKEAFKKYANIDLDKAKDLKSFKSQIKNKSYLSNDWNDIFYSVFLNEIEPNLPKDRPIIVYDYPLPQASLSKRKQKTFYAERFEVYIGGMELANAFSELTDAKEQLNRLKEEQLLRKKLKKEFVLSLKLGLPESGGIALGVERLQMLLLDIKDMNDLLLFPVKKIFK